MRTDSETEVSSLDDFRYGDSGEVIRVRLITGESIMIRRSKVAGYCHYHLHRGCLNKRLIEEHQCIEKSCRYLEILTTHSFWITRENEARIKEKKAQKKQAEKERQRACRDAEEACLQAARKLAEQMFPELRIIMVKHSQSSRRMILYYVSDEARNDWYRYLDLARAMRWQHGYEAELRHIKDADGQYVTLHGLNLK